MPLDLDLGVEGLSEYLNDSGLHYTSYNSVLLKSILFNKVPSYLNTLIKFPTLNLGFNTPIMNFLPHGLHSQLTAVWA